MHFFLRVVLRVIPAEMQRRNTRMYLGAFVITTISEPQIPESDVITVDPVWVALIENECFMATYSKTKVLAKIDA